MGKFIGKRLLQLVFVLFAVSFMTFALMYIAPGDPAERKLSAQGEAVNPEVLEAEREKMGLNQPFAVRYFSWLGGVCTGNLGTSYVDNRPVITKLGEGMAYTVPLAMSALAVALAISLPLGILSAVYSNSVLDIIVQIFSFIGNALPNFLIAVLLIFFFCIQNSFLPVIANNSFTGLILPTLSLAIPMCGRFIKQFRGEVIEQLDKDYITGLRVRGIKERKIIFGNVLHNSSAAIITITGLAIGTLMGGSVVIESIFRWPGVGKLVMDSITARDYPVIQGFVLIMAVIYVLINLATDILYRVIDPRIDYEK